MSHAAVCAGLLALLGIAAPVSSLAQPAVAPDPDLGSPIVTTDGTLHLRLNEIARRSALWREGIEALRGTGRQIVVVTPDEVLVKDSPDAPPAATFDPGVLAAVAPVPAPDGQVRRVVVVVNLPLIEGLYRQRFLPLTALHWDLDGILVHEVYGHALPYLLAGSLSGQCPDPVPGQRATDACSIRRENAVRRELRLRRRTDYGLNGLMLAHDVR